MSAVRSESTLGTKKKKADQMVRFQSDSYASNSDWMHIDKLATLTGSKLDGSFSESEQRVVSTLADVFAGVNTSATLAHDDSADDDPTADARWPCSWR